MPGTRTDPTLLWVCICCMLAHCNGDASGCEYSCDPEHHTQLLSRISEDDVDVTAGLLWEEHTDGCTNRAAGEWIEECGCEIQEFSSRTCQGCGSPLAGERHALTEWSVPDPNPALKYARC